MKPQTPLPIIVFADGASLGNPGPGGWGAIIALPDGSVYELGGREAETTNNRMELMGTIGALESLAKQPGEVALYLDSTYVIRGITQWIWGWMRKGWKTAEGQPVSNEQHWKRLQRAVAARKEHGKLQWHYVRGHSGIPGNERVDEIATSFAKGKFVELYRGPLLRYSVPIHDIPEDTSLPEQKPIEKREKARPYSYLSVVNGVLARHASWAECEARVKGRPGAKFKKAMSAEEERQILASWGLAP